MQYHELFSDMCIPGRWMLADPFDEQGQRIDPWQFFADGLRWPNQGERQLEGHAPTPGSSPVERAQRR
jgi:hypothetical protein